MLIRPQLISYAIRHLIAHPRFYPHAVIGLTLLTTALRLIDVDARGVWLDESFTVLRVWDTWAYLFGNIINRQGILTLDIHPFGYFAALKIWSIGLGSSSFVLRLFSAFGSILTVPLTWMLANRLLSRRAALLVACLAVLSPSSQWFAGEIRMYSWLPALASLSTYLFVRATQNQNRAQHWWISWLALAVASVAVHYSMVALLVAQVVAALVWLIRQRNLPMRNLLIAGAIFVVLAVIVVATNQSMVRQSLTRLETGLLEPAGMLALIFEVLGGAVFGLNAADPTGFVLLSLLIGLLVAAACVPRQFHARAMLFYIVVSFVAWWVLSLLIANRPTFRYLVYIVPFLQILPCVLIDWLLRLPVPSTSHVAGVASRGLAGFLALFMLVTTGYGLAWSFMRTSSWQDDWRSAARLIRQNWQPGDVIIANLYTPEATLALELGDVPIQLMPSRYLRENNLREQSQRWIQAHARRVWFANTGEPGVGQGSELDGLLPAPVLQAIYTFPGRSRSVQVQLIQLQLQRMQQLPVEAIAIPKDAPIPRDDAAIVGYTLAPGNTYWQQPNAALSLFWRYAGNADQLASHKITLRLVHDKVIWWTWQLPAQVLAGAADGPIQRVDYPLPLPLGLPRLPYQMTLEVQRGDKAETYQKVAFVLPDREVECCVRLVKWPPGDGASTATIAMQPASPIVSPVLPMQPMPRQPPPSAPQAHCDLWRADDVALMHVEYPQTVRYGDNLPVVLTWCAQSPNGAGSAWDTRLSLQGLVSEVTATQRTAGTEGFPVSQWSLGEPVRDQYALSVPPTLNTGWYRLQLERLRNGQRVDQVLLGLVQVEGYAATALPDPMNNRVAGNAGAFQLLGYGSTQPITRSMTVDVHTYWRVAAQPDRDGVLFLHVMGPSGELATQDDNRPEAGTRSTLTYRAGEQIDLIHRVALREDAPPGEYKLYAGVYDRDKECCRWEVAQSGQRPPDDRIYLGSFTLPALPDPTPYDNNLYMPMLLNQ